MGRGRDYSKETIKEMLEYRAAGFSYKEIGEIVGRTAHAVEIWFGRHATPDQRSQGVKKEKPVTTVTPISKPMVEAAPVLVKEKTLKDFQEREMIKYLYDRGYRIEDNTLVCLVKQKVKLQDIING